MTTKTTAIVAYLTIIGWIISLISYNNSPEKSSLVRFHLRQFFGLFLTAIAINIIVSFIPSSIGGILSIVCMVLLFILWLMGIMSAANETEKPMPFIGEFFDKNLTFIK